LIIWSINWSKMGKNSIYFYFCGSFAVISMFNLLQAESKKNANPYNLMNSVKYRGHQQDMKEFGSEVMDTNDQKTMYKVLHTISRSSCFSRRLRNLGSEETKKPRTNKGKTTNGVTLS